MNFDDILEQAIEMLQRHGRLTYRTLKRQFHLDDETLEDLTFELIEGQRIATDENGTVLVWIGETYGTPALVTQPDQTTQQLTAQEEPSPQVESPPTEPHTPDAERRQLTVMFCDLVGSTELSSQLDPEDYRDVVRAYQETCGNVIQRFDCHVAQTLGDGLLIYSGYPVAHENDAERAVRVGLGILNAMQALNERLEDEKGIRLAVRVGIHTGPVVVGEVGAGTRQEQLALGETPNIAARIQGIAEPNSVVISSATYRLVQGFFDVETLGEHELRGVTQPITVYRVFGDTGAQSRLEVAATRGLTPLIGRESETTLLFDRWAQVKDGQGQVVHLSGEVGIGKSRLVQVLKDHVSEDNHTQLECRSSPYFTNSALYPVIDLIQRTLRWQQDDTSEQKLDKLTHNLSHYRLPLEETVPLFGALLSLPVSEDQYPPLNLTPQRQRQKTLEAIVAITLELSERQPVLFILEDLHWVDPTTLELLDLLIDQTPTASLYTVLTCRPEFQPSWQHRSYLTEITLNRLSQNQIEQMAQQVAGGKGLPDEIIHQLVDKTDGVPLYVEEMTKSVLESGVLKESDGRYELTGSISTLSIPTTLQDSLMSRLDRLVTAKAVAQYASVIGRQFSYELLQAVSGLNEAMLQHELARLVEAELIYQRGVIPQATYIFKHALIQDIAYESLLRSTRQEYHRRIAEVLEEQFPEAVQIQPELLARHYTEARLNEQAIRYWQQAGERAVQQSAYVEAISHLNKGLELLQALPDTPERTQQEVTMHIALGASLLATKGQADPEVGQTYTRARQLCQHLEDPNQLFPVLRGLHVYYLVRAEFQTAHTLGEQLLTLAQQVQDAGMLIAAHRALGVTLYNQGVVSSAQTHFAQGVALYDLQQHGTAAFLYGDDSGVVCHSFAALTLWLLGYPDQGLVRSQGAATLAQQSTHLYSLSFVLIFVTIFHQLRREGRATQERAEDAICLAQEQGFPLWMAVGAILYGWALAHQGQVKEGMAQITQGLMTHPTTGAALLRPYFLALLADVHGTLREPEAGLTVITEALAFVETTGERWYESELYRLKGQLLLQQSPDNATKAETCFQQAVTIAQNQQAKSWELRAATSLAKLWQRQGKRQEAHDLLAPVYGWFTEGFDTADLKDAKTLLDELEGSR
jgi:TOMM system kinase/cyclase fusion protein